MKINKYLVYSIIFCTNYIVAMECFNLIHAEVDTPIWDNVGTRFTLLQNNEEDLNWLFVPGGPGADSSYFKPLIQNIKFPGKVWLIDFPSNGDNTKYSQPDYNFDEWFKLFLPTIKQFKNPIYVGHSIGAIYPLMFPELEDILKGFIIIASSPKLDVKVAKELTESKKIIVPDEPFKEFLKNPNSITFKKALIASSARHFSHLGLESGRKMFQDMPFNYYAPLWLMNKIDYINKEIIWVPQNIPTLIIGGSEDCINPISLYLNDALFKRPNISIKVIQDAGHFPWIEKICEVVNEIQNYIKTIL